MKWIGQHVWDYISRFRNDVYLEDISTGTIASGGNLGLDSNNKIVKATIASGSGDITEVNITTDSGGGSKASETSGSADFSILGTDGVGVTNSGTTITAVAVPAEIDHDSLNNFNANEHFTQANITTVGTIGTGVWQGTAIAHAYIGADAIEGDNIADAAVDSEHFADGCIDTDHIADDQVTYAKIQNVSATDRILGRDSSGAGVIEEITPANLRTMINVEDGATADQSRADIEGLEITTVGTITTGRWQGTAIASAYLDADTMHYSAQRQLTHHMFKDDIDTTKHYIGLQEADAEQTNTSNKNLPLVAPVAGKLLKVFLRANSDLSGKTLTWRLETRASSASTFGSPSVIGTQSGSGCTGSSMTTYDFTSSLDDGTNVINAGDQVLLSIQSDASTGDHTYLVTCMWEWDLS